MTSNPDLPQRSFHQFSELPQELQFKIWQHVIPDPYSIPSVIVFIINPDVNLGQPRGFLPSAKVLLELEPMEEGQDEQDYYFDINEDFPLGDKLRYLQRDITLRQPIFNLMQTCRDARTTIQAAYVLDIPSTVSTETKPLCEDREDLIYFYFSQECRPGGGFRLDTLLRYLANNLLASAHNFADVRHIGFLCTSDILDVLEYPAPLYEDCKPALLLNFPALESISMFINPEPRLLGYRYPWTYGKLVLYPPENNIKIDHIGKDSDQIQQELEMAYSSMTGKWEAPIIDVYVAFRRDHKKRRGRGI